MKKVFIYGYKHVTNTGGYDPEDSWSRDSSSTDWTVVGVAEKFAHNYCAFDDIEVDGEGKMYALYAIYSTGDSFGHDDGAYFQFIWAFKDIKLAEAAMARIKDHSDWYNKINRSYQRHDENPKKYKDSYSVEIDIDDGKKMTVCASWNGYFESLNVIDVVEFTV